MISAFFHTIIYAPLYNGLVFFVSAIPTHDVGIAVILLTIVVRVIIYPLSRRAILSQMAMKKVAPEVEELKKKHKDKPAEQSQAIFALYRQRGVHPFASFGILIIQIPVVLGLYWVFVRGGLPTVDPNILYSFIHVPPSVNMFFLGFIDMAAKHNIILALLVVLTQFIYTRLSMGKPGTQTAGEASLSTDMAKSFDVQARYILPLIIGFISYSVAAAAPLYWITSNLFMIAQEYITGRRF
jgi:YidC/Oxa1 family membrane protein insertase